MRDLLLIRAVDIDEKEIEVPALGVGVIGGKNNLFAARMEERRKAGRAEAGDLPLVAAVGVHDKNFQLARTDEIFFEQRLIICQLFWRLRVAGTVNDLGAIG